MRPPMSARNTRRLALLAVLSAALTAMPGAAKPRRVSAPTADLVPASATPARPKPPTLVVAISVDQYSADLFSQYRRFYTHGLARLQDGAVYPQGFQSHAATETCPGHSTLLTGDRPARTGIIANYWYDPAISRADKRVYCAEDERDPASTSAKPVVSAAHLLVPTLGERMKAADPRSLNVAVSGKDRAVAMMGGAKVDAAYWWRDGGFVTYANKTLSPAAVAENQVMSDLIAKGAPGYEVPAFCVARSRAVPVKDFTVGTYTFPLAPATPAAIAASPRFDEAAGDLAIRLVDELKLGADAHPDVLSVSFSATDYIGHTYGTQGVEMCIQQAALDVEVGKLLDALDARGIDYVVVLSADHGGIDTVERLDTQGYPAAIRATQKLMPDNLGEALTAATGIASPGGKLVWGDGGGGDYYLARDLPPAQREAAVAGLVKLLQDDDEVAAVFTTEQLAAMPQPAGSPQDFTLAERARASFYRGRSGDVVALLKRGVSGIATPRPAVTATHGSPWDYDRRVPILFWRKGLAGYEQPAPVETVDIAPTLAALLGLAVKPGDFDGRCLDLDGGPGDTCGGTK